MCVVRDFSGCRQRRGNVSLGPKEDRNLITGLHTVADIYCKFCNNILGWKYVRKLEGGKGEEKYRVVTVGCVERAFAAQEQAYVDSEKYKEGKFILEKAKMVKVGDW